MWPQLCLADQHNSRVSSHLKVCNAHTAAAFYTLFPCIHFKWTARKESLQVSFSGKPSFKSANFFHSNPALYPNLPVTPISQTSQNTGSFFWFCQSLHIYKQFYKFCDEPPQPKPTQQSPKLTGIYLSLSGWESLGGRSGTSLPGDSTGGGVRWSESVMGL